MLKEGDIYTHDFSFSQSAVEQFAEVTGDKNPIHIDEAYAANTIFKRPIMHGFLGSSIFSKVFGTLFPGEGTIYLKQEMSFLRPMYAGEAYTAHFTVKSVDYAKNRAVMLTEVKDPQGKVTISGEAIVQNPRIVQN